MRYSFLALIFSVILAEPYHIDNNFVSKRFLVYYAHFTAPSSALIVVPETEIEKLTHSKIYHIRTRIVIETVFLIDKSIIASATDIKKTQDDLDKAVEVFSGVTIKFDVVQISYIQFSSRDFVDCWIDALNYQDCLSIYYVFCHPQDTYVGLSSPPWIDFPYGIILAKSSNDYCCAHEIGHYFGLFHSFQNGPDGDYVDDTPCQETIYIASSQPSSQKLDLLKSNKPTVSDNQCPVENGPNCRNLMNYCDHSGRRFITDGQKMRMRWFLEKYRQNNIIPSTELKQIEDLKIAASQAMSEQP